LRAFGPSVFRTSLHLQPSTSHRRVLAGEPD
jgi:hypothetical protein